MNENILRSLAILNLLAQSSFAGYEGYAAVPKVSIGKKTVAARDTLQNRADCKSGLSSEAEQAKILALEEAELGCKPQSVAPDSEIFKFIEEDGNDGGSARELGLLFLSHQSQKLKNV